MGRVDEMTPARFDAIVFDFDGVLVESVDVKTQAFASLYEPHGEKVVRQVVAWHLAHGGVSRFEKFRHFHWHFLGTELSSSEEAGLGERFSMLVEDAVVGASWVPGAREFLESYFRSLPLYVASGTPDEELRRILDRRNIRHYFRSVAGSPLRKEDILRHFAKISGVALDRMLMIGDATTDFEGALGAGTCFLGRVKPGLSNPFPANVPVVPDLQDLPEFLCP
jgi:phosphoglycolate phosphatase-like HAD superfamily hydrolase